MANPFQSLYFAALGASPFFIGILVAYGTVVTILALLIGGYVADTWGRRRVIIIFSWLSVSSSVVYFLINSAVLILIPLTLASLASMYTPAFNSLMMDSIEPSDRIRGFSVFNAINTIPSAFVPTASGLFMDYLGISNGLKIAYLVSASFGVLGVGIRTWKLGETYKAPVPTKKLGFFSYIKQSFVTGFSATRKSNSIVKKLLLYVTLAGIGTGLTSPFVSIYVVDHLGINPLSYSLVVDIAGLATVILLLMIVILIQKLGARNSTLLASVASPLANVVFTQSKTMDELLEWGVTGAVATALQTPSMATMQAETIPLEDRGKILAMFSILPAVVSFPSQILGGFLYSSFSPLTPFLLSIVPFGGGALILYTARSNGK